MDIDDAMTLSRTLEALWNEQKKCNENQVFANSINEVLESYEIREKINHTHLLRIKGNTIDDLVLSYFQIKSSDNTKLTTIIENFIWNVAEKNTYLYHFTSEKSARSIEGTGILRLSNILNRYEEGEIKDFIEHFKIPHTQKENYHDIFYASLTPKIPKLSDTQTIKNFRHFTGHMGARLKFKVIQKDPYLRHINYDQHKFNIIHDLRKEIKEQHDINLIINGFTTRFASFYINKKYSFENEVRLYRNLLWDEGFTIHHNNSDASYIELPIDQSILKLEEVIYESDEEIFDEND